MNADQQRTIERVQKLFALARNNPNPEEAMSARLKARRILIDNGLDPDMFNEDMTSTVQAYDEAASKNHNAYSEQQAHHNYQNQGSYQSQHNNDNDYQYQEQPSQSVSNSSAFFKAFSWLLFRVIYGAALFGLISLFWPWSIKSLLMTIGFLLVLANIQYIIGIGIILGLGYFFERLISG